MKIEDVWKEFNNRLDRDVPEERVQMKAIINEPKLRDILRVLHENRYLVICPNRAGQVDAYRYCN